jgi:hypothetical protein
VVFYFSFFCRSKKTGTPCDKLKYIGIISDSYKISDSIPRICQNDASKLAQSLHASHDPRLTAREPGRPDGRAKIEIS